MPEPSDWLRVLTLQDFNTRVVVLGTALLGAAAGVVGSFALLRKRALMGDALSHATLPGIAGAFILVGAIGGAGKSLGVLLAGATVTGVLGVATILFLRSQTRLKEDTALGIVLSVFFGGGVMLLGVVQNLETGSAAGLEGFVYGKTASMTRGDVRLIGGVAVACVLACALLFKEFKLLCFDDAYARTQGWPTLALDVLMMTLVTLVTIVGLQAVGLILVIALLIIPAAAARFWTRSLGAMSVVAAGVGAASCAAGAALSAGFARLPSGATIVLTAAAFFLASMFLGGARGVIPRWRRRRALARDVGRQHLLRAVYELAEGGKGGDPDDLRRPVAFGDVLRRRSWGRRGLSREVARAVRAGRVLRDGDALRLTDAGVEAAARATRNHRLWELYLIEHADVAPSHVDRGADAVEDVLGPDLVRGLERLLADRPAPPPPASPHALSAIN